MQASLLSTCRPFVFSDYLNNDIYYRAKYDLHNFNRAANQLKLLKALLEKRKN